MEKQKEIESKAISGLIELSTDSFSLIKNEVVLSASKPLSLESKPRKEADDFKSITNDLSISETITLDKVESGATLLSKVHRAGVAMTPVPSILDKEFIEFSLLHELTVFGRGSAQNQRYEQLKIMLRGLLN